MSLRVQKPGRSRPPVLRHPDRPPIWADGCQKPPFDLQAFLRASLAHARVASIRGLDAGAGRAARATGRLPRLAGGAQALCAGASGALTAPADDADTRVMTAVLAAAFPAAAPQAPVPQPRRPLTESDPTLAAIRAVLRELPPEPSAPPVQPPRPHRRGAGARLLAALAVALLLPFGAARALYAHLSGEDLRLSG